MEIITKYLKANKRFKIKNKNKVLTQNKIEK